MADKKISALTSASTPLAGTEVLPIVQSSTTKQVSIANVTAGRAVSTLTTTALGPNAIPITLQEITAAPVSATAAYVGVTTSAFPGGSNGDLVLIPRTSSAADVRVYVGSGTPTEALVVQGSTKDVRVQTGNVVIGTAAKGIDFSANTGTAGMTSELLNWYEDGTWTPASGVGVATSVSGVYTRIGRQVTVIGTLTFPVQIDAGVATITGLPFASGATGSGGSLRYTDFGSAFFLYGNPSASTISFFTVAGAGISYTSISGKRVDFMMTYFV